ncbi:hypothetical protein [Halomonas getboli]|uniref:hypothetical protein n=1 Tax=Halomonas getboli TaxID=2935862 RepID=UPI001FFEBD68|nr:hypothetical protein [Halomonas getboli]MCK2182839.1 hypothetical protein [Halomonas getboli]
MTVSRRRGAVAGLALAVALLVSGCSYTPARIDTGPLVEVGGYHDGHRHYERRHYRHHDDHYRDRRRHRRHHRDYREYRDHRGGFCPPGQARHGRC